MKLFDEKYELISILRYKILELKNPLNFCLMRFLLDNKSIILIFFKSSWFHSPKTLIKVKSKFFWYTDKDFKEFDTDLTVATWGSICGDQKKIFFIYCNLLADSLK